MTGGEGSPQADKPGSLSRRKALLLTGLTLTLIGFAMRPRAVEVRLHPRREAHPVYWQAAMAEPAVRDVAFFRQTLINRYESPPLPFPERTPPYRVTFSMHLVARDSGTYRFELDSAWNGALEIEGKRVFGSGPFFPGTGREGDIELAPGVHRAELVTQPEVDSDGALRLLWRPPGSGLRTLRATDLSLPSYPRLYAWTARLASPLLWMGGMLLSFLSADWIASLAGPASRRSIVLASVLVGLLALLTRGWHFDTYPRTNLDETHNGWAGWNLLHEGEPKSWSWLPGYESKAWVSWFSYEYPIVPKAFDHPPLTSVLAGATATLLGAENMFQCTLPRMRPLMVLAGTLSVVALLFVAKELTDLATAVLASVLMAVSPLAVFNSRLVKEDVLVQLFLLLAVYNFLRGDAGNSPRLDWVSGVFCGLAALSKVHGIGLGFALAAVALSNRPRDLRRPARILVTALAVASLYPIYGLLIDSKTYLGVMSQLSLAYPQESIADKFHILHRLILEPKISAATPLIDGFILLGWLSLYHLHRKRAVSVVFVLYLLLLMATLRSRWIYGFYIVPLLPVLCLAAAFQVRRTLLRQDVLSVFLFVGLCFLPTFGVPAGLAIPGGFRSMLLIAGLPIAVALFRSHLGEPLTAAGRYLLGAMLTLSILASVHRILTTL